MSKGIRRPALTTPFDAKHIIVASCAAVAMVMGAMSVTASVNNSNDGTGTSKQSSSIVKAQEIRTTSQTKGTSLTSKHTLEVREFLQAQNNTPLYTSSSTPAKNLRNNTFSTVITAANPVLFISQLVPLPQTPATPVNDISTSPDNTSAETGTAATPTGGSSTTTPSDNDTTPITGDSDSSPPPEKTPPSDTGDSGTSGNSSTLNMSQDPPPSSP
jgi:hypothetical protein